uniref:tRNA methyltransferase 5 n=1 Tax=Sinocyclocheilus anshuiensis TaxID=1608454 RepID=A0A671LRF1_9TELE
CIYINFVLFFLLQKHHSCISLSQNLNQFARIYLQCSSVVHSQKAMTDQPQTDLGLYKPPQTVRGMTELDRAAFSQTVSVPAIRIPTIILNKVVKSLKKVALQRPGLKRVVEEHNEDGNKDSSKGEHRLLLLDPNSITSADSFGSEEAEALKAYGVAQEIQKYQLKLTYENLKSEEILRAVLPEGQDVTSGFSRVGHIAHMNLRDHQLPYRKLIGQVIIDKNPGVTCVVNKTNTIDSTYRNFQMEVLAGESNMVAKVRPVRERLPALMKGSQKIHVVMNLPALALEFLDAFRGLLGPEPDQSLFCPYDNLPQVHCYGFSKEDDAQRDVVERAEVSFKISLQGRCSVHLVRNVAPNKEMMCVSFTLPRGVLYSTHTQDRPLKASWMARWHASPDV